MRSDNAGCYHCGYLLLSLPSIVDRTGVKITRYDFSEPQAGKDRFLNEGNDIKTASDMKTAFESYGGVKGCYAAVSSSAIRTNNDQTYHDRRTGIE